MTLADLRAKADEAERAYNENTKVVDAAQQDDTDVLTFFRLLDQRRALTIAWQRAADLYMIARDEGLQAAMLWKLQHGGA